MRGERPPAPPFVPPPVGMVDVPTLIGFEARWWRTAVSPAVKDDAIRSELGVSAVRYYQLLNRALDTEEALALEPVLVNRLRRLRARRQDERVLRREHRVVLGAAS